MEQWGGLWMGQFGVMGKEVIRGWGYWRLGGLGQAQQEAEARTPIAQQWFAPIHSTNVRDESPCIAPKP